MSKSVTCKTCGTKGLVWLRSAAGKPYLAKELPYGRTEPHFVECKRKEEATANDYADRELREAEKREIAEAAAEAREFLSKNGDGQ